MDGPSRRGLTGLANALSAIVGTPPVPSPTFSCRRGRGVLIHVKHHLRCYRRTLPVHQKERATMNPVTAIGALAILFAGTHLFASSAMVRPRLVQRLGEQP